MRSLNIYALVSFLLVAHVAASSGYDDLTLSARHSHKKMLHKRATDVVATTKRGASYNDPSLTQNFGNKVTWAYNWAQTPGNLPKKYEYVPMLWGLKSGFPTTWKANAENAIKQGATHLLGFNEPDHPQQANLTPQQAAAAWKTYMQPFAGKAKLCSPAITNGAAPMGQAWLDSFLTACSGCTIDCIAIHIYDSATNVAYFQQYISGVGSKYKKPVWVTEFGATGTLQQQEAFIKTMLPYLDGLASVQRYAYFMAGQNILVDNSGKLTALGGAYNTD